jgi:hypothetical protein
MAAMILPLHYTRINGSTLNQLPAAKTICAHETAAGKCIPLFGFPAGIHCLPCGMGVMDCPPEASTCQTSVEKGEINGDKPIVGV